MPNINTLKEYDKKLIEEITNKELNDLTSNECAVLRARRGYLTADQKDTFKPALDGEFLGKDVVVKEKKTK